MSEFVVKYINQSVQAKERLHEIVADIDRAIDACKSCLASGNKLLFVGNGGSAADAQHLAAEFVGRYEKNRKPLPALALTTDTSAITCIANDYDFASIFERQIIALGNRGDVLIAISTSGNSPNILRSIEVAKQKHIKVIGFSGKGGGQMAPLCDVNIIVPSNKTSHIQEAHIAIGHMICEAIDQSISQE